MKLKVLRRWHRRGGVGLAPFLLLHAVSGLFLSFGLFHQIELFFENRTPPPVEGAWNLLMARVHFGPGILGTIYHVVLVLLIFWVIGSGTWMWYDGLRRRRRSQKPQEKGKKSTPEKIKENGGPKKD